MNEYTSIGVIVVTLVVFAAGVYWASKSSSKSSNVVPPAKTPVPKGDEPQQPKGGKPL